MPTDTATPPVADTPPATPPKRRRGLVVVGVLVVVALLIGAGGWAAWARTDLPPVPKPALTTLILNADGDPVATFATENRIHAPLESVPKPVRDAVVAAVDPDFYSTGPGVFTAVKRLFTAGDGLSISEQYVRNSWEASRDPQSRARVAVLASKLEDSMSKDEILGGFLDLVYFGRGASGIRTASQAYFGKDVSKLTLEEGAVLAATLDDPTRFDPQNDLAAAKKRWQGVLDAMVANGTLDRGTELTYPQFLSQPKRPGEWRSGSSGILGQRVETELKRLGFSERDINTGGLTVRTTIKPAVQQAAEKAARSHTGPDQGSAIVAIDPATGAVLAYYGGDQGYGKTDFASAGHPAAATIQPFVVATALANGKGLDSVWNGTSGQTFADLPKPLDNAGRDSSCGARCTLAAASAKSVETVFWAATATVGAKNVAATAWKAGLRTLKESEADGTIALGRPVVSALDQASAYATIANNGVYREPRLISEVLDADGKTVLWSAADNKVEQRIWPETIGKDVQSTLQRADGGLTKAGGQKYRSSSDAWLVGYTPTLVTAVWTGTGDSSTIPAAERSNGLIDVRGAGLPGTIWRDFTTAATP